MLRSNEKAVNGKIRRHFRATPEGKNTLKESRIKAHESLQELIEGRRTP
jgi:hypothetical protein